MNIVVVTNQREWDALPPLFERETEVQIKDAIVVIHKVPGSSQVTACDSSQVAPRR